jgi:hypothetical protein
MAASCFFTYSDEDFLGILRLNELLGVIERRLQIRPGEAASRSSAPASAAARHQSLRPVQAPIACFAVRIDAPTAFFGNKIERKLD